LTIPLTLNKCEETAADAYCPIDPHHRRSGLLMRYKWLLLDADGTLFDYDQAEASALEKTLEEIGVRFEPRYTQIYRQINARMWRAFEQGKISQAWLKVRRFELLFEAIGVESDPETISVRYLQNLADGSQLIEDAEEVVRRLSEKVGLVLITNGLQMVQRSRLAKSPIVGYFTDILISEEVGAAKPDGRIFDMAFGMMNNPSKAEVLMVGDSLTSDIKGGNDYGIDTCWFNPKRKPCDQDVRITYEIHHLSELLTIVEAAQQPAGMERSSPLWAW